MAFLNDIVATQPKGKEIHIICDNLSAHKTQSVRDFLAAHPNLHIEYTPTYSSWLNQVEFEVQPNPTLGNRTRRLYLPR